jgi:serine/threonine-protein kinase
MGLRFGRYETVRSIASGGMATVYLGRAVAVGGFERLVAIKVMHEHIAKDPDFQSMFLDEARLAARIRHPNVVGTIDVDKSDHGMFLVMEFVDGPSLHNLRREFRRRRESIPLAITLRIFIDALAGLHAAHELTGPDGTTLNLVHRDVSPQNILVGKDGVTRITDFGVARAEARISSTRGGQLKGKLAYMPSEQVRNLPVDRRTDVYAAGVAFWEALAGKRLFRADNEAGLIHMILEGAQEAPTVHNPDVPEAVVRVVMKALSTERDERQQSAAEFADELEDAAQEAGIRIATARKVASFIELLPPSLSQHPAPMTTTPSSFSLADIAAFEIAKLDGTNTEVEAETRMVDSAVSRADQPAPSSVTTASAVVASQKIPGEQRWGGNNLWMFVAGAVAAVSLAGVAFIFGGASESDAPSATSTSEVIPGPAATATAAPTAETKIESPSPSQAPPAPQPSAAAETPPLPEGPKAGAPPPSAEKPTGASTAPPSVPKTQPKRMGPGYKPKEL